VVSTIEIWKWAGKDGFSSDARIGNDAYSMKYRRRRKF
jgi:hypothetical protein